MASHNEPSTRRMTRSSTKTQAVGATAEVPNDAPSTPESSDYEPESRLKRKSKPKRGPKRSRNESAERDEVSVTKAPKRVKSGKLQVFINMPVEVFIEIAKYLHPFDLVLLSRVNKFFRELFMSRQAVRIWRSAQQNVPDLPPCPESICEPQYAALLFTKICSICGSFAPRNMDPILLVRLCVKCRETEARPCPDPLKARLLPASTNLMPGKHRTRICWYLRSDMEYVETKVKELNAAGDNEASENWEAERHKLVDQRYKDAGLLRVWLGKRERDREAELDRIKKAREAEIESRLIILGWERGDFNAYYNCTREKQWRSLVYNTKPLTDRTWSIILPRLVEILEVNRKERLEREESDRKGQRFRKLGGFARKFCENPLVQATVGPSDETGHLDPVPVEFTYQCATLLQSSPDEYQCMRFPEFVEVLNNDMPMDKFELELAKKQPLLEQSISKWRNELETRLVKMLPKDTCEPNFNVPGLTLTTGSGEPISNLPLDTQKLLRADVTFSGWGSSLYHGDFSGVGAGASENIVFDMETAKITKALLTILGRPDASCIELKSLGRIFRCGRCHAQPQGQTWKDLVLHYREQTNSWNRAKPMADSAGVAYFNIHDVNLTDYHKPLMMVGTGEDQYAYAYHNHLTCRLCERINLYKRIHKEYIAEHLRDVHLIEEPEAGTHY